jgi:hypothetical protein
MMLHMLHDLLAVGLALLMFGLLWALAEGIDRV